MKAPAAKYLVLARRYRPQTFRQVVDQKHVTRTISNAIKNNRLTHAVLLSGPRGTGKTTIARILAKTVNCKSRLDMGGSEPCNKCKSCNEINNNKSIDVFEIDGASNNSVDQIRSLRENVRYMSVGGYSKIYIIDEVHMLSGSAFNALLKTLEEPPQHVIFIFATTEYHKIPATIISRCQHYNLRSIKTESIRNLLVEICNTELFSLNSDSLWVISKKSDGSIRDALSLLDQVISCYGNNRCATYEQVTEIIGLVNMTLIRDIVKGIFSYDIVLVLDNVDQIYKHGYDLKFFYGDLLEYLRSLLLLKIGDNMLGLINLPSHEIKTIKSMIKDVSISHIEQVLSVMSKEEPHIMSTNYVKLTFEIMLFKLNNISSVLSIDSLIERLDKFKEINIKGNMDVSSVIAPPVVTGCKKNNSELENASATKCNKKVDLDTAWQKTKETIYKSKPSLAASLSHCCIQQVDKNKFKVEAGKDEYTFKVIKKNFTFLKKVLEEIIECKIDLSLGNDLKKYTSSSSQNRLDKAYAKIKKHPSVARAIEMFEGKIEHIEVKLNNREK